MSGFWTAWARSLQGLTPTAKLVTAELALLADARGVAITPLKHLTQTSGRTSRAVREALSDLEAQGLIRRPATLNPGRPFRGVRIQLVATPPESDTVQVGRSVLDSGTELQPRIPADGRTLQMLLRDCIDANWQPPATWALSTLIETEGERRFGPLIRRRKRQGTAHDPWDTLTLAWETIHAESQTILQSKEPWAMWVHLTGRACLKEDREAMQTILVGQESALEALDSARQCTQREDEQVFGLDDFDAVLRHLVLLLVRSGVPEAVAWAGTARILELVEAGPSRRHWLAGKDAKLQALGIEEHAARMWMTLVAGSRRGADGVLTAGFGEHTQKLADQIALAYSDQFLQLTPAS